MDVDGSWGWVGAGGEWGCDAWGVWYRGVRGELRLIAARNYIYDRQLKDFNTAPSPVEVHRLVEEEKRSGRVIGSHGDAPEPEAPPKDQ